MTTGPTYGVIRRVDGAEEAARYCGWETPWRIRQAVQEGELTARGVGLGIRRQALPRPSGPRRPRRVGPGWAVCEVGVCEISVWDFRDRVGPATLNEPPGGCNHRTALTSPLAEGLADAQPIQITRHDKGGGSIYRRRIPRKWR